MIRRLLGIVTAVALIGAAPAPSGPAPLPVPAPDAAARMAVAPVLPVGAAPLIKTDVDAWLDGFLPYALDAGDVAGAEVVVVKDGQILTQRGFGFADAATRRPVDPATTLFRTGSISKLFTWTAVMQLVQAGKLDLDRDVNDYLDFRIPPAFGKPITLRNLMTHTGGFAEQLKYLLTNDPQALAPLDQAMKRFVPERIYAPGTMPAYSNYGASLAGYIVQRVSGERFDLYIQRHIFAPIGMTRSTFQQPLPASWLPHLSKGYVQASLGPLPFELVAMSPAGSMTAPGVDMARFMLAYLSGGGPLLSPATTQQMHAVANRPIPGLPAMALGFVHEDRNGLRIVGHGGDTGQFHSDLHLYLDRGVGLYISFNSSGKEAAAYAIRDRVFTGFTDRYFPAPAEARLTLSTAQAHGAALAGRYVSSRASAFTFARSLTVLGQTQVILNPDHTISVTGLTDPAGGLKRWREVAPWQWMEVGGRDRIGAVVDGDRVRMFSTSAFAPIFEFIPAPASLDGGWIMPLLLLSLLVLLATALAWPIVALVRRRYAYRPVWGPRALLLRRSTGAMAWLGLVIAIGWLMLIQTMSADLTLLDGRLDLWIRVLQLLSLVFIVLAALAVWNMVRRLRAFSEGRWSAIWSLLVAGAALFLVFAVIDLGLLTPSLNY